MRENSFNLNSPYSHLLLERFMTRVGKRAAMPAGPLVRRVTSRTSATPTAIESSATRAARLIAMN